MMAYHVVEALLVAAAVGASAAWLVLQAVAGGGRPRAVGARAHAPGAACGACRACPVGRRAGEG